MTKTNEKTIYKLFACCKVVLGPNRALILDLQRARFHFIPLSLSYLLLNYVNKSTVEIKKLHTKKEIKYIDQYFDFLIKEEYVYECDEENLDNFPDISLEWDFPGTISNVIIDLSEDINLDSIIDQLEVLGCQFVELRSFKSLTFQKIEQVLSAFSRKKIFNINIIIPYDISLNILDVAELPKRHPRIQNIFIFNSAEKSVMKNYYSSIYHVQEEIKSDMHCGIINADFFTVNLNVFTESLHHNSCLNRKISIDVDGNIKNCPSMSQSFGNIKDTTLREALDHPDFKKYWNVTKDQIAVCKDCEFRYICTDCRAYLENPEDMYSKPLKCGYNPYTCEWEEWSTNPLKQKAIDYYGMRHVLPEFKLKPDYVPPSQPAPTGDRPQ